MNDNCRRAEHEEPDDQSLFRLTIQASFACVESSVFDFLSSMAPCLSRLDPVSWKVVGLFDFVSVRMLQNSVMREYGSMQVCRCIAPGIA